MYKTFTNLSRPAARILIWSSVFLVFSVIIHTGLIRGSHANQEMSFLEESIGIYEVPQSGYSFNRGSGIMSYYIYGTIEHAAGKAGISIFDFLVFVGILILTYSYSKLLTNDHESGIISVILISIYPAIFYMTSFSSNVLLSLLFVLASAIFYQRAIKQKGNLFSDVLLFSFFGILASVFDFYLFVLFAIALIFLTVSNPKKGVIALAGGIIFLLAALFTDPRLAGSIVSFYPRNVASGNIIHNFVNILKYNMLPLMLFGLVMNLRHRYGMSNKIYYILLIFVTAPIILALFATDATPLIRLTAYAAIPVVPYSASFLKDSARNYDANFFGVLFLMLVMALVCGGMFFI